MAYVKVKDGVLEQYPYSKEMLIRDNPNVSFGYLSNEDLSFWGLYIVHPSPYTEFNRITHKLIELDPVYDGENWIQQWSIEEVSAEEKSSNIISTKNLINKQAQDRLDSFAMSRGYDNIMSACSYVNSTNITFQSEAQKCIELRDSMWNCLMNIFTSVDNNLRAMPININEIENELPVLAWD